MSELGEEITERKLIKGQQSDDKKSLLNAFSRLRKRFKKTEPNQLSNQANQETVEPKIFDVKLEDEFNTEELKPSHQIFFHTVPASNLQLIIEKGLFTNPNDPNIGRKLGYSLFFPYEHTYGRKTVNSESVLKDTPNDYVLTIWEPSSDLLRCEGDVLSDLIMKPVEKVNSSNVPEEFFRSSPNQFLRYVGDILRLPPEHMLAAIPLSKAVREEMLKAMVLMAHGRIEASKIEEKLFEVFQKERVDYLKKGETLQEITHQINASIQRDLVRYVVMPWVAEAKLNSRVYKSNTNKVGFSGNSIVALWRAMAYRSNVNDAVSAKYLDKTIDMLKNQIVEQKVDINLITQIFNNNIKQIEQNNDYELKEYREYCLCGNDRYYGGNNAGTAAFELEKELEIR